MEKTQQEALKRALVLLNAAGVEYVIRTNDGQTIGTLAIAEPQEPRRTRKPSGIPKEFMLAIHERLKQTLPGDCPRFSAGEYKLEAVRSNITGYCTHKWGKGAYISTVHRDTHEIEVLRLE
jgi:hypothetical protein